MIVKQDGGIRITYEHLDLGITKFQKVLGTLYLRIATSVRLPVNQKLTNFFYDCFSLSYDSITCFFLPKYKKVIELIVSRHIPKNAKTLDLCCGTGNITIAAAKKSSIVIGVDSSRKMLEKAREKAQRQKIKNIKLFYGDVTKKLSLNGFDVVIAAWAFPARIHPFKNKNQTILKGIHRILKRNGKMIMFVSLHEITPIYPSIEEYATLLGSAGFKNLKFEIINNFYIVLSANKSKKK